MNGKQSNSTRNKSATARSSDLEKFGQILARQHQELYIEELRQKHAASEITLKSVSKQIATASILFPEPSDRPDNLIIDTIDDIQPIRPPTPPFAGVHVLDMIRTRRKTPVKPIEKPVSPVEEPMQEPAPEPAIKSGLAFQKRYSRGSKRIRIDNLRKTLALDIEVEEGFTAPKKEPESDQI